MSGLNPSDHDLLQAATKDQVANQLLKYRNLNVKLLYKRCKKGQKSLKLSMITSSAVLNVYVFAVINYGIGHL